MEKGYTVRSFKGKKPIIPESCVIFEGCVLLGDVRLGENCVLMPNCVLRADNNAIIIGDGTNIQDLTCIHSDHEENGAVVIGKNVTVGHKAMLHGCKIGDDTLIGMCATVLSHTKIGENCLIGAGSLVTERTIIPDGNLAFGSPAKVIRPVGEKEIEAIRGAAEEYIEFSKIYEDEREL